MVRQYRAQLKRRAQQVQEELVSLLFFLNPIIQPESPSYLEVLCTEQESDRKILAALLEGEQEEQRMETARRERAIADTAWMKRVIEDQLQLEREREAEFDILHR